MRFRIVKASCQPLDEDILRWAVDVEFLDLTKITPDVSTHDGSVKLNPFIGAGEWSQPPSEVNLPRPHQEIEIVLPIAFVAYTLCARFRGI